MVKPHPYLNLRRGIVPNAKDLIIQTIITNKKGDIFYYSAGFFLESSQDPNLYKKLLALTKSIFRYITRGKDFYSP